MAQPPYRHPSQPRNPADPVERRCLALRRSEHQTLREMAEREQLPSTNALVARILREGIAARRERMRDSTPPPSGDTPAAA